LQARQKGTRRRRGVGGNHVAASKASIRYTCIRRLGDARRRGSWCPGTMLCSTSCVELLAGWPAGEQGEVVARETMLRWESRPRASTLVRSRYGGAFVHSIAWVQHERGTTEVGSNRQGRRLSMPRRLLPNLIVSKCNRADRQGNIHSNPATAFPGTRLFDYLIHFGVIQARQEALGPVILAHFVRVARAVQSNNS
jgi:hypothetical protein